MTNEISETELEDTKHPHIPLNMKIQLEGQIAVKAGQDYLNSTTTLLQLAKKQRSGFSDFLKRQEFR
jgi:hypothetical protein